MEKLQKSFQVLEELLRQATNLISPMSHHDDLKFLTADYMAKDSIKNNKCYLTIRKKSGSVLFPICSRAGMRSPEMIQFSMKLAKKLAGKPEVPPDQLQVIINKLSKMNAKYSKPLPKSNRQAYLKRLSTTRLRNELGKK
jgi:hypothetical protein